MAGFRFQEKGKEATYVTIRMGRYIQFLSIKARKSGTILLDAYSKIWGYENS